MSEAVKCGTRVVRGLDWEWDNQDGGEGHVGTIVDVGGNSKHADQTVVVLWDCGVKGNYRAGYQCKDDLRVLDSAPAGIQHRGIICDECRTTGIMGCRWKCAVCCNYDLCSDCYMAGKHNKDHKFYRYDTFASCRVNVPPRSQSTQVKSKGIFVGAKVARGRDWSYGDQDGGSGEQGTVRSIGNDPSGQSWRSWVKVIWNNGRANDYRRGHEGSVDVKCETAADGGYYYDTHLPTVETHSSSAHHIGDKVQYDEAVLSKERVSELSQKNLIAAVGKVTKVDEEQQRLEVNFGAQGTFTSPPSYFVKAGQAGQAGPAGQTSQASHVKVGDSVKILDDVAAVRQLQNEYGGWVNDMKAVTIATGGKCNGCSYVLRSTDQLVKHPIMAVACVGQLMFLSFSIVGESGKVVGLNSNGSVKVQVGDRSWTLHPKCCSLISNDSDSVSDFARLLQVYMRMQMLNAATSADSIVSEAAQGNVKNVETLVKQFPGQVDVKKENRTALMVASYHGHQQVVAVLLGAGAKPEIKDNDGDNAFHYAAYGNKPGAMEILLKKNSAGMNAINNDGRCPLQVAVCKQHVECARRLINYKCDVNHQDNDGDTPLHDALFVKNSTIVDLLIDSGRVDFKLKNAKGFNVLHLAAAHGHLDATGKIIKKAKQLVNVAMSNGYTPLHLAVANGRERVAAVLIDSEIINLEILTDKSNTALLIAINKGFAPLIELLTLKGANLEAEDSDGDTAIHLVCIQIARLQRSAQSAGVLTWVLNVVSDLSPDDIDKAPQISKIYESFQGGKKDVRAWLAIACFLAENGADTEHKNRSNVSAMDELQDSNIRDLVKKHCKSKKQVRPASPATTGTKSAKCMMCSTEPIGMTFHPCGHSVACIECSSRMKQCFDCHERIQEKVRVNIGKS